VEGLCRDSAGEGLGGDAAEVQRRGQGGEQGQSGAERDRVAVLVDELLADQGAGEGRPAVGDHGVGGLGLQAGDFGCELAVAGPTEILVIADEHADPFVVAVDLLSQAEHGPDSPAVLVTPSETLGRRVIELIDALLPGMPTADFAGPAWRDHGEVVVVDDLAAAWKLADQYAAEHVEVLTENPRAALAAMRNYGALFLGDGTCVSYGDKVIGTNHTLPTRGAANYTGGLWVGKYLKTVTYQEVTDPAASARLGELCGRAARVEFFEGHARSGDVRASKYAGAPLPWAPAGA
jgi:sulfopropanediol 3-dehydrogenase